VYPNATRGREPLVVGRAPNNRNQYDRKRDIACLTCKSLIYAVIVQVKSPRSSMSGNPTTQDLAFGWQGFAFWKRRSHVLLAATPGLAGARASICEQESWTTALPSSQALGT